MRLDIVAAVAAMAAITFTLRSLPILARGNVWRRPGVIEYMRVVAPAVLGALAAVTVASPPSRGGLPQLGIEAVAVLACIGIALVRRSMLWGLLAAVILAAGARYLGLG